MKYLVVVFILLALAFCVSNAANPTSVPIGDPVYAYLERMETLGKLGDVLDGIKPFSRDKIAGFLLELNAARAELTSIDRRRLDDFLLDYRWEINRSQRYAVAPPDQNWYSILADWDNFKNDFGRFFQQKQPEEENHVFLWEKDKDNFYFDYEQGLTYENRSDDLTRSASWTDYIFRGVLNEDFGFQGRVSLIGLRGDENYVKEHPILKGSWSEKNDPGARYADRTGGELALHSSYIDFQFAHQEVEWGYGESGKLILSNNPEQYPYLSLSKDGGWWKFISLHGKLQSYLDTTLADGTKIYPDKWLAAHRLEVSLWQTATIGLNENFIYGNRYADWAYLIPFNFYRAAQHKLRDRDNATISVDLEVLPYHGVKIYGTLFLDEFRKAKLGTDWYGNKHAFQIGLLTLDPLGLNNLSLRLEYTAIMPWVYTHDFRINSYSSDYRSLGHWSGPNSEVYYLHLAKDWHQRLSSGLRLRQWKHGANYDNENIGGDIFKGHRVFMPGQTQARETRKFLEGILTTEQRLEVYSQYEIFNDFYLSGEYRRIRSKTEDKTSNLNEFYFTVVLKY